MKKFYCLIVFFICLLGLFLLPHTQIVSATAYNVVDWSSAVIGSTSGTEDQITYQRISGNDFRIENSWSHSDDRCLYVRQDDSDNPGDDGWINLTTTYDYIGCIVLYGNFTYGDGYHHDVPRSHWIFRNATGDDVLFIGFRDTDRFVEDDDDGIVYADDTGTYHTLYPTIGTNSYVNFRIVVTHMNTNVMNYSVYTDNNENGTYVLYYGVEDSSRAAATWTNFTRIYVDGFACSSCTISPEPHVEVWMDDIIIFDHSFGPAPYYVDCFNVTNVEETTATLHGDLRGTSVPVECGFWISNVSNDGSNWLFNVSSGTYYAIDTFDYDMSGLSSGEYYYVKSWGYWHQGVAMNTSTVEQHFLTKPPPPTNFQTTAVTDTSATFCWSNPTVYVGNQTTVIVYKEGSIPPTSWTDGTIGFNGTGTT